MNLNQKMGKFNAARVLHALGRIGYHPASALLDIADNGLSAKATRIGIHIDTTRDPNQLGRPKAIISSFAIIDNGLGMDEDGLDNAIQLGSSADHYEIGTLSKFGMGLKSAAFSLGNHLEIISRCQKDLTSVQKIVLDYDDIVSANGQYVYTISQPSNNDIELLDSFCTNHSGTIVRITKIHTQSMPRPSEIIDKLSKQAGIIYHYYLSGSVEGWPKLNIEINELVDGFSTKSDTLYPINPLFEEEAADNLEEQSWDGISVKWIQKPRKIQLDLKGECFAEVAITQLPHPPSVGRNQGDSAKAQKECRDKYLIEAGNYGFFIYRNYRLISWADSLDGMVTLDKKLYSFRGRILIDDSADELLNIDVTKTRINLSEIARNQLFSLINEAKNKSQKAWAKRTDILKRAGEDIHIQISNEIDKAAKLAEKDDLMDEDVAPVAEQKQLKERRKKATIQKPASVEESRKLLEERARIQYVDYLENNQLWERASHAELGLIVRVNQSHRFFRNIPIENSDNTKLIAMLDLLFFSLAKGEFDLVYKYEGLSTEKCDQILQEYRERVGSALSEIIRRIDVEVFLGEDNS